MAKERTSRLRVTNWRSIVNLTYQEHQALRKVLSSRLYPVFDFLADGLIDLSLEEKAALGRIRKKLGIVRSVRGRAK